MGIAEPQADEIALRNRLTGGSDGTESQLLMTNLGKAKNGL